MAKTKKATAKATPKTPAKKKTTKTSAKSATKKSTAKASTKSAAKSGAKSAGKSASKSGAKSASKAKPVMDRRTTASERRTKTDRREESVPVKVERRELGERREKVARRRQIDPTTCERNYDDHEVEFMQALDAYKRASGRMFPTCSEILEVIKGLGYQKMPNGGLSPEEVGEKVANADKANAEPKATEEL